MNKKILALIVILSLALGVLINHILSLNVNKTIITEPERLFNSDNDIPVSNSDPKGNKHIFKSFFAYNEYIHLENFISKNNLYYKKITSYLEYLKYKEIIPELRTLTRDDFINYYLIIVMSDETDYTYMLEKIEHNENKLNLQILKNKSLSETPKTPIFSGVSIILPNITEVPNENIELTINN